MIDNLKFENPHVIEDTYFRAIETFPGIFKISQPWFAEGKLLVYSFLIVGTKAAIVYDSMFGYGNLRKFCEKITDLPLLMVNSHFHGDHAAGNFDFDACFIHPYDLAGIYHGFCQTKEELYERALDTAVPEFRDKIRVEDMCAPRPMKAFPIFDGDVFDIGDRELMVVHVGGHSPGSIMLLDPTYQVAYSGDTCNNDTIVTNGDSIEEYLQGLIHLRKYTDDILYLFGGHEDFPATIIDEGIELLQKVISGTDDRAEYEIPFPPGHITKVLFGAKMKSFYRRVDGKDMNVQYKLNNIFFTGKRRRIISGLSPDAVRSYPLD